MTAAVLAVVVTVALLLRAIRREPVQGDGVGVLAACVITGRASWRICFDSQTSSVQPGSSHRSHVGLKAIAVVDNTACGPAIGGVRMAPDVSTEECFRLARAMTWKNAAAGLPHGGGKSVIFGGRPPSIPCARRANASENAESDRRRDAGRNSCGRDGGRLQLSFPKSAWIQCSFSA